LRHFRVLRPYVGQRVWRYAIGILALLVADGAQLVLPQVLERFVNTVESTGVVLSDIAPYAVALLGLAVVVFSSRFGWRMMVQGASRLIDYDLRRDLFTQFTRLAPNYFNHKKTGDLMAHATNDLQAVRMALNMGIVTAADAAFLITSTLIIMFSTISPSLSAWALAPLPLAAIVTALLGRQIHARFLEVQNQFSSLSDHVQENFAGIRIVKTFVQEDNELARLTGESREYFRRNMHLVRVWALIDPLTDFIVGTAFCVALAYGGILVIRGAITLGAFVAFTSYLALLAWPMQALGFLINMIQRAGASLERLEIIYRETPEIAEDPHPIAPSGEVRGDIEFRDVTFAYPGTSRQALKDVSFRIEAGSTVAFVGRTGNGKSTILNLILRVFDPPVGSVFLDGIDVRKLPLGLLRESIGYVPPDNFLFSETISQNIAFGVDDLPEERIEEMAEIAQVKDNILDFPLGFHTMLGERGVTLSGGQKQRVSIARALAKDPPILILDDSFSAVDTATEEAILDRLWRVREGRTTILVAHRISTIKRSDHIFVVEDGRIVEDGRHEDLVARGGLYASMHQRQLLEDRVSGSRGVGA